MSLSGKVEAGAETKTPASMVHEYFCSKLHHMPKFCTDKVQTVDLPKGEWGRAGSVIFWCFATEGETDLTSKEIMKEIDYENNKITCKVFKGVYWSSTRASILSFKPLQKVKAALFLDFKVREAE